MNNFNPNDAPEGMVAVKTDYKHNISCKQCFYYEKGICETVKCCAFEREDGCTVIFQKKGVGCAWLESNKL